MNRECRFAWLLAGALGVAGCASPLDRQRQAALSRVPIETRSPGGILVNSARISPEKNGIYVSGTVRMKSGYAPTKGHVHVFIVSCDNEVVRETVEWVQPRAIPRTRRGTRGRSSYYVNLDESPTRRETIRAVAHSGAPGTCVGTRS